MPRGESDVRCAPRFAQLARKDHMPAVQYIVEGGRTLSGTIRPSGNKNAALPIVAAALLSENVVRLDNVPHIRDIETLIQLIRSVGVSIDWTAPNSLAIHAAEVHARDLD